MSIEEFGSLENAPARPTMSCTLARPKREDPFFGFTMPRLSSDLEVQQFLYLLRSGASEDLLKIGVANNLQNRINSLAAGNPHGLVLLASRQVHRCLAFQVERRLHAHFADRAHGREWFKVDAAEVLPVIDRLTKRARSALKYYKRLNGIVVI